MLQFSNFVALHVQQISNTIIQHYHKTDSKHFYEVSKQWCIVS